MRASPPSAATVTIRDWRHVDAPILERCYAREQDYWRDALGWDSAWTWTTVERARTSWSVPGFVAAEDDGTIRGWSFHILDGSTLRIGGLVADDPTITRQLLDATIASTDGQSAAGIACFVVDRAPDFGAALQEHGLMYEPFRYLSRPIAAGEANDTAPSVIDTWDGDVAAAGALFASAYPLDAALHFTASGSAAEWSAYLAQLIAHPACGELDTASSVMIRDAKGLAAVAIITTLSAHTAHLAQVAVRHDRRGGGLAAELIRAASSRAREEGKETMTLLVSANNRAAGQVYARLGFSPRAAFVAARSLP